MFLKKIYRVATLKELEETKNFQFIENIQETQGNFDFQKFQRNFKI